MKNIILIDSHHREKKIEDEQELQDSLRAMQALEPQISLLEIPNFGILTIGTGPQYGFVEYMSNSGEPPYLLATESEINRAKDEFFEFDSGGTLTPIPGNKCIPIELVIRIATDVIRGMKLPEYVKWQEE